MTETIFNFVAMEYYWLILNRTYLLSINDLRLEGRICRGITSTEGGVGATKAVTSMLAVHGDLNNHESYVDAKRLKKPSRANFSMPLIDIFSIDYTPKKKWGMGYYPHDGRIFVRTPADRREFIILGNQSGQEIADRLSSAVENARKF